MKDLPSLAVPYLPQNLDLPSLGDANNMFIITSTIEYILATKGFDIAVFNPCYEQTNITAVMPFLICSVMY